MTFRPERIISGGQTGVDRAALDAAGRLGIETGGWCPKDRRAEDGRIPDCYALEEMPSPGYDERTRRNVLAADATLIVCPGELAGGTALTASIARELDKPSMVVDPREADSISAASSWIKTTRPRILNVAGPRESRLPGIQELAESWLLEFFSEESSDSHG